MPKFNIDVSMNGRGTCTVDGKDVSRDIHAIALFAKTGEPTVLQLYSYAEGILEGEGVVEVYVDNRKALGEFLRTVDSKVVDKRALGRSSWGDQATLTDHVIAVLLEMLDETQPGPHPTHS